MMQRLIVWFVERFTVFDRDQLKWMERERNASLKEGQRLRAMNFMEEELERSREHS